MIKCSLLLMSEQRRVSEMIHTLGRAHDRL